MKNLLTRSLSSLFIVAIIIGALFFNSLSNYFLFLVLLVLGLNEFYSFVKLAAYKPNRIMGIIIAAIIYTISYFVALKIWNFSAYIWIVPVFSLLLIMELYRKKEEPIANLAVTVLGILYLALPLSLVHFMVIHTTAVSGSLDITTQILGKGAVYFNAYIIVGYFMIQWTSDTGAYLAGITLGKHRLFERISPKKSWEGAIGGFLAALAVAFLVATIFPQLKLENWIVISIIINVFGVYGDLLESLFKRSVSVKDSGNIIPGHGGILDRFDSTLLALPVVFFYLQII